MAPQPEVRIGERLRFYRQGKGKTQAVVAGLAGVTEDYLSQIERGLRTPALPLVHRFSKILGVRVSELLGESATEHDERVHPVGYAVQRALMSYAGADDNPDTLAVLRAHVEMLDQERKDLGPDYHDEGWPFCWENGKPPHPDMITRRFKKLTKAADLPEIDLHDVRHSYATAGRNAKIDWKALSKRIGHADVAFTMKQYVQTDLEADREVANTLADLILGGLLATDEVDGQADDDQGDEAEDDEELA
jgi:transcriptional regulator with XRE-family HTH domain